VSYVFKTAPAFRKALAKLEPAQKRSAKAAFKIFKENPFDPRLRTHKIHKLSAIYGKTIHSAWIEGDLRSVFYIDGDMVVSVDIGTHDIYRG
jgi:mRNA-degrading endonuclease YafQ of YafQ-DinJ toxin-antitoxin module